jgi:hypothetical protein
LQLLPRRSWKCGALVRLHRAKALQQDEELRQRPRAEGQIELPFAGLGLRVKAVAGRGVGEGRPRPDRKTCSRQGAKINRADAVRLGAIEGGSRRQQRGLQRGDEGVRLVKLEPAADPALARPRIGRRGRRLANDVIGGRRNQRQPIGQPIFDIGSKFELLVGGDRDQIAMGVESAARSGKRGSGDDLPLPPAASARRPPLRCAPRRSARPIRRKRAPRVGPRSQDRRSTRV